MGQQLTNSHTRTKEREREIYIYIYRADFCSRWGGGGARPSDEFLSHWKQQEMTKCVISLGVARMSGARFVSFFACSGC